jgi:putative ubiquitin-RnfH superfamily antitoxin RatB of RatAB toxin-antitoxin module
MSRVAVTVIYACAERQAVRHVELDGPLPLGAAVNASGLLEEFPEIDLARNRVGVFGKLAGLDTPLQDGDQVEIYRPLRGEPKESRRKRAADKADRCR